MRTYSPLKVMNRSLARRAVAAALAAVVVVGVGAPARGQSDTDADAPQEPALRQVAELPVLDPRDVCLRSQLDDAGQCPARVKAKQATPGEGNGVLLLDPQARRGYLVYDRAFPNGVIIDRIDLDSLEVTGRTEIPGFVTVSGGTGGGGAGSVGVEPVHAIGPGGRLYLALADSQNKATTTDDGKRPFKKIAVIDDAAWDSGSVTSFLEMPAAQSAPLAAHGLAGMTYSDDPGGGRLLLLFSALDPVSTNPTGVVPVERKIYDHYLARWSATTSGVADGPPLLLEACQRAPIVTTPDNGVLQAALMRTRDAIYLACQPAPETAQVVRIPVDAAGAPQATGQETFPLPKAYSDTIADPVRERFYVQSTYGGRSWWAFDGPTRSWAGAVALTQSAGAPAPSGLDPVTGRLYMLVPDWVYLTTDGWFATRGGLQYTDGALTPVPEAMNDRPDMETQSEFPIRVDPVTRRVFVRRGDGSTYGVTYPGTQLEPKDLSVEPYWRVFEDTAPVPVQPSVADLDQLTADVDEAPGVTDATFTAAATGYGARALLTGGAAAATSRATKSQSRCLPDDRELVLGEVGSTEMSNVGVSASAAGLNADQFTKDDLGQPASRCWPDAFGAVPASVPAAVDAAAGQPWDSDGDEVDDYRAECAAGGQATKTPERRAQAFNSSVACDPDAPSVEASASGALVAAGAQPPPVQVGAASSEVELGRAEKGILAEVDSIARDIVIEGVGTIGAVRTETVVQAAGRPGTAKTTFTRTICGVDLPTFKQSGCMSEAQQKQFVDALNRALGRNGQARLRDPDPVLAEGTPGGYQAGIQRRPTEAFSDRTISRDGSLAVPGLEIIFYRDDPADGAGRQIFQFAGVQASSTYGIFCLNGPAGEEEETDPTATTTTTAAGQTTTTAPTSTTTTTVPDATTTTTVAGGDEATEPVTACKLPNPSTLTIELTDTENTPLTGGVFGIRQDVDADGVVGPDDALVPDGTCITAADGTGDCTFELGPGTYVIEQTAAPAGYAPAPAFAQLVEPEMAYTVTFQNLRSAAGVQISLADEEAKPLAGGVFELIADDGDGVKGSLDVVYASCTTAEDGSCPLAPVAGAAPVDLPAASVDTDVVETGDPLACVPVDDGAGCVLEVPLGSYVVRQSAAPDGYTPGEDVAFTFDQPGQAAVLSFVNARAGSGAGASEAFDPGEPGDPGEPPTPPTETLVFDEGRGAPRPIVQSTPLAPPVASKSFADRAAGVVTQIIQVPAQLLKLAFNSPREMALMGSVWALLFLPCYLGERRRLLARLALESHPGDASS